MELNALDVIFFVADSHDVAVSGAGGDFKIVAQSGLVNNKRMVAGELAFFSYRAEKPLSVQVHFFDDSVLDEFGSDDFGSKGFGDSLVAKTDSQNGNFSRKIFYRLFADARVARSSWAWRND